MIFTAILVGLSAMASGNPVTRQVDYPPTLTSKGFTLVLNVTDLSRDLTPSVHGSKLSAWHQQSIFARAVPSNQQGNTFYQNGTGPLPKYGGGSTILTDLGPNVAGIQSAVGGSENPKQAVQVNFGGGNFMLSEGSLYSFVWPYEHQGVPTTFIVCNETIEWISRNEDEKWPAVGLLFESYNKDGNLGLWVPDGCAPVKLVPQCATLPDVPPGSSISHEFAQEIKCYEDVTAIEWSKYQ